MSESSDRFLEVEWDVARKTEFLSQLKVMIEDRKAYLKDMTEAISGLSVNITSVDVKVEDALAMCMIPTEQVVELKGGKKKETERKFFPGYMIIKMELTEPSWLLVKNTNNVIGFIGGWVFLAWVTSPNLVFIQQQRIRSEERRVGKECRSRWSPYH